MKAILILLHLGEVQDVLRLLHESQQSDTAALFADACKERGISAPNQQSVDDDNENSRNKEEEDGSREEKEDVPFEHLLHSINLDYGHYLEQLGNSTAAEYYW